LVRHRREPVAAGVSHRQRITAPAATWGRAAFSRTLATGHAWIEAPSGRRAGFPPALPANAGNRPLEDAPDR